MARARRRQTARRTRQPCVGCQDFGSSTSKLALAFERTEVISQSVGPEVSFRVNRVPLRAGVDDPERSNASNQSSQQFEFPSFIGFDPPEGDSAVKIQVGRGALLKDLSIPLKTVFVWLAGIHDRNVLIGLPNGSDLVRAIDENVLQEMPLRETVKQHFSVLKKSMLAEANTLFLVIKKIVLSYPNYLCERKGEPDLEKRYYNLTKYLDYYVDLMEEVWADHSEITFAYLSEGHATALYICEPFDDANNTLDRDSVWAEVAKLLEDDGGGDDTTSMSHANTLVVDMGASSINFHYQHVYFSKEEQTVLSSQSGGGDEAVPGTTGGSHLTNQKIRAIIEEDLTSNPDAKPGHLAELLEQYEVAKHSIDYTAIDTDLRFITTDGAVVITLPVASVKRTFTQVFDEIGLELLDREVERLLDLGESFTIIFCGGSYINVGLRRSTEQHVRRYQQNAKEAGLKLGYLFLASFDTAPRAAVACGGAIAGLRIPTVDALLEGSAIGIQVTRRVDTKEMPQREDIEQWDKETDCDFLFSKGCESLPSVDYKIPLHPRDLRFRFICDTNYYSADSEGPSRSPFVPGSDRSEFTGLRPATGTTTNWARFPISEPTYASNTAMWPYELGFHINAGDIPSGTVRFCMAGETVERLAARGGQLEDPEATAITVEVQCFKVDDMGFQEHPLNMRWRLKIISEPGAKLLSVEHEQKLPFSCSGGCGEQLEGDVALCTSCPGATAFCSDCYADESKRHAEDHEFEEFTW